MVTLGGTPTGNRDINLDGYFEEPVGRRLRLGGWTHNYSQRHDELAWSTAQSTMAALLVRSGHHDRLGHGPRDPSFGGSATTLSFYHTTESRDHLNVLRRRTLSIRRWHDVDASPLETSRRSLHGNAVRATQPIGGKAAGAPDRRNDDLLP